MDKFWWVIGLIAVFVGGQWFMMRPNPREQRLMLLREAARKMGFQPKLVPPPSWYVTDSRQFIACYSLIVPTAKLPYSREQRQVDGSWQVVAGQGLLHKVALIPEEKYLMAIEAQANSISIYWQEDATIEALTPLKAWMQQLANS